MGDDVQSFAAGFAQAEYDERALARTSAARLRTRHKEFEVPADVFRYLPQIVWHADEPFFDSSCLPTFVLARETKKHVTVVLSGDGGDEAFAGYERYAGMRQFARWRGLPGIARKMLLAAAGWRNGAHSRQGWDRAVKWLEHCLRSEREGFHPYVAAMTLFEQDQIRALYGEKLAEENAEVDGRESLAGVLRSVAQELNHATGPDQHVTAVSVLQRADLLSYLPGDVLCKVDRMSMAHGLEVRSPFLDPDLLDLACAIPDEVRLQGKETKPILRRLALERLPSVVTQARKRGFGVPLDDWFRGPLEKTAREVFESSRLAAAGVFKPRYWEPLWKEHLARRAQHGERLYALLALEFWYRIFLDGVPAPARPAELS
jgi:asparagine synthase (glutamine-hydrolysing)